MHILTTVFRNGKSGNKFSTNGVETTKNLWSVKVARVIQRSEGRGKTKGPLRRTTFAEAARWVSNHSTDKQKNTLNWTRCRSRRWKKISEPILNNRAKGNTMVVISTAIYCKKSNNIDLNRPYIWEVHGWELSLFWKLLTDHGMVDSKYSSALYTVLWKY